MVLPSGPGLVAAEAGLAPVPAVVLALSIVLTASEGLPLELELALKVSFIIWLLIYSLPSIMEAT